MSGYRKHKYLFEIASVEIEYFMNSMNIAKKERKTMQIRIHLYIFIKYKVYLPFLIENVWKLPSSIRNNYKK